MVKKINSCVFISGNGSNLKSIIKNSLNNNFPIKVGLVISNNAKAMVLGMQKNIIYLLNFITPKIKFFLKKIVYLN